MYVKRGILTIFGLFFAGVMTLQAESMFTLSGIKKVYPVVEISGSKISEAFKKAMTPIVHFIDYKTGQSYYNVVGYNNREEFLHLLKSDK